MQPVRDPSYLRRPLLLARPLQSHVQSATISAIAVICQGLRFQEPTLSLPTIASGSCTQERHFRFELVWGGATQLVITF